MIMFAGLVSGFLLGLMVASLTFSLTDDDDTNTLETENVLQTTKEEINSIQEELDNTFAKLHIAIDRSLHELSEDDVCEQEDSL